MTENSDTRCEARLSRRELEVLSLIAEGMSTREVARALWITEETVKSHVARVLGQARCPNARACDRDRLSRRPLGAIAGERERREEAARVTPRSPGGLACGQLLRRSGSSNGATRSIGTGKTIVELFADPISSSVCR